VDYDDMQNPVRPSLALTRGEGAVTMDIGELGRMLVAIQGARDTADELSERLRIVTRDRDEMTALARSAETLLRAAAKDDAAPNGEIAKWLARFDEATDIPF
jgi:hypothetical protein